MQISCGLPLGTLRYGICSHRSRSAAVWYISYRRKAVKSGGPCFNCKGRDCQERAAAALDSAVCHILHETSLVGRNFDTQVHAALQAVMCKGLVLQFNCATNLGNDFW
jgi:hypothetical protein